MKCDDCKSIKFMERRCCGNLKNWDPKKSRLKSIEECQDGCQYYDASVRHIFDNLSKLDPGGPNESGDVD